MTDKTERTIAETRAIKIHPWWHTAVYAVIFTILAVFTYLVLDDLTNRINTATDRADANEAGVAALAEQVEDLGGTPVITPSDIPANGTDGEDGEPGPQGDTGPAGEDGEDGENGRTGAVGADGGTGAAGTAGEPGEPGSDGAAGAAGADGAPGEPGPAGPAGAQGEVGPAGPRGEQGVPGETGPAGPTCPEGYTLEPRMVPTNENPLGEPMLVCVQGSDSTEQPPVAETRG